jgi:hypothetical protein
MLAQQHKTGLVRGTLNEGQGQYQSTPKANPGLSCLRLASKHRNGR